MQPTESDVEAIRRELLSTSEAARLLGRSTEYVRRALRDGRLEGVEDLQGGRKRLYVTAASVEDLRAELTRDLADQGLSTVHFENAMLRRDLQDMEERHTTSLLAEAELEMSSQRERIRRLQRENDDLRDEVAALRRALDALARRASPWRSHPVDG